MACIMMLPGVILPCSVSKYPCSIPSSPARTPNSEATTLVALFRTPLGAGIACCHVGAACDITRPPSCYVPAVGSPSSGYNKHLTRNSQRVAPSSRDDHSWLPVECMLDLLFVRANVSNRSGWGDMREADMKSKVTSRLGSLENLLVGSLS
jgi:hypothetical protein